MNQPLNIYADGCRGGVQMFGDMVTTWHYDIGDQGERGLITGASVTGGHVTAVTDALRGSGSGIMIERERRGNYSRVAIYQSSIQKQNGRQICSEIGRQRDSDHYGNGGHSGTNGEERRGRGLKIIHCWSKHCNNMSGDQTGDARSVNIGDN